MWRTSCLSKSLPIANSILSERVVMACYQAGQPQKFGSGGWIVLPS